MFSSIIIPILERGDFEWDPTFGESSQVAYFGRDLDQHMVLDKTYSD